MTVRRLGAFFAAALGAIFVLTATNDAAAQRLESRPQTLWVEAESFADRGGWALDSQAMDVMGSPYLLAHGLGVPVADAKTTVRFPSAGEYKVYARTRNWVAPWRPEETPGTFQVAVDGKKLETVFGTNGAPWSWQAGGTVAIAEDKLEVEIALCDMTGFDGRVDALVFSADGFVPPEEIDAMKPLRLAARGLSAEYQSVENGKVYDLVVVGGGIAGTAAALSAARLGLSVALVQDRPVLGGNGSSEVRVGLNHFLNLPPYPNLGNLTFLLGPHHGGNAREAEHYRDRTRAELVALETNIDLYLNVRVNVVESAKSESGSVRINAVCGENVATGERLRFVGKTFADCTGDATVGFLAGADFRMGRESKAEYDEPSAPEEADAMTMGSSVQWNTVETDAETSFPEVPWAIQFSEKTIRPSTHGDWDWEAGMNLDQIADIERIRDIGLRAAYGHWSYMKNRTTGDWAAKVKNRKLGWVAFVAGKRESRRLLGDVVLREQDIVDETPFEDASVTTTWPIDLHYPAPDNV
ncbi:MAG: FAD-dependent oxidoreductase, partial [Thermoguttaceae bacterium]|nr:FAD-dependent oxidoreductase [Thermoguttaceae bacterium]